MRNYFLFLSMLALITFLTPDMRAQGIANPGQILSTSLANQIFGQPIETFSFNKKALLNILNKTPNYVLFGYKNKKIVIANAKREIIYPADITIQSDDVLNTFGSQVMSDFIEQVNTTKVLIEIRPGGVLTISSDTDGQSDGKTLEYSVPCPPLCPW